MILGAIVKEAKLLLADKGGLASMFLLPILFMAGFGLMFRGGGGERRSEAPEIAVAGENAAALASLGASDAFRVRRVRSADEAARLVAADDVAAGVVLPNQISASSKAVVYADLRDVRVSGPVVGALRGLLVRSAFAAFLPPGGISGTPDIGSFDLVEVREPPGGRAPVAQIDSFQITVPGNAVLFAFFLAVTVGLSFVEERKSGCWKRFLAAPVSRPVLLAGKLVPFFVMGLVQEAFFFGVGIAAFGLKVGGTPLALAATATAVTLCAVSLGFLVASFGGTEKQVSGFTTIAVLVFGLLGGCMFPRVFMPPGMKAFGLFTPHAWALDAFAEILTREGTGIADIAGPLLALLGFASAFLVAGLARFRFER